MIPEQVRANAPLHCHTSLRVGGLARFLAEPSDARILVSSLRWVIAEGLAWVCLGAGTNVIFPDSGFPGVVLHAGGLRGTRIDGVRVAAAAGEPLSRVARLACEAGLSGMEWAWGIPGSVGGAVAMNAGAQGGETADVLVDVETATAEGVNRRRAHDLGFGYRRSLFLTEKPCEVVTEATFELAVSTPERTVERAQKLLAERGRKFPSGATAGCTFRNPPEGPAVGELLDRAGCKGLRVGSAWVSDIHANFIINDGSENAADVLELIEAMRRRVRDACGVDLIEEIVLYP